MSNSTQSFAASVWSTLSATNVNDKAEKKQNLTYLSWAWAWGVFKSHYPESTYIIHEEKYFADGTCEVSVTVTCKQGENSLSHFMWLPVIDHRNKAITSPNAFDINKNKMRCLVKCLAMFGLGLYIYAGEDLPEAEQEAKKQEVEQYEVKRAEVSKQLEISANQGTEAFTAFANSLSDDEKVLIDLGFKKQMWNLAKSIDAEKLKVA